MKKHGRVEVELHALITLALDGGEWPASLLGRFNPHPPISIDTSEINLCPNEIQWSLKTQNEVNRKLMKRFAVTTLISVKPPYTPLGPNLNVSHYMVQNSHVYVKLKHCCLYG
jgi:hypothetical protein